MRLFSLLRACGIPPAANDAEITKITDIPEQAGPGALFVCIRGSRVNGAAYAAQALSLGAAAVVSEEPAESENNIVVENSRKAFSELCAAFYGRPYEKLKLIGITGTNGKTTTAYYIRYLLEHTGHSCALIGTLGADTGAGETPTGYTTPTPDTFFAALADAVRKGCEYCVCEVSSQALSQYRVDGARFRLGVFTNLGTDHLDYHKTAARLAAAKRRLCALSDAMLINADDAYGADFAADFAAAVGGRCSLYSCGAVLSDFAAKNVRLHGERSEYTLFYGGSFAEVRVNAPGLFSVYNSLCAAAVCLLQGIPLQTLAPLLETLPQVPGRMQRIEKNGVTFWVDFAHTPDALAAALRALRPCAENGKLIAVFGCGGDRDRTKRPAMGKIASALADTVILTSDNPRSEDPVRIIREIRAAAVKKATVFCEPDRALAIKLAYEKASPGDVILVAGKGHETVQIVGDSQNPFSDIGVIKAL